MRRLYDLLNALILGWHTWFVLSAYGSLPAKVPLHFDLAGTPDRWGGKSGLITLLIVTWGLNAVFYALALSMRRFFRDPALLNIPHKEEFLKLDQSKKDVYIDLLREFMTGMAVPLNFIFASISFGMVRVARGAAGLPGKALVAGLVVTALMLVYYTRRLILLPGRLIRGEE